ncbi:hypothetical protein H7E67_17725 [Clostridium gasigenes]|uniref:hypothetical protein n=1 Tax=Clostridium gasigenes TaxID=94869 RepID=UPI001623721D|nr:hypothetical protein [Clostridium gasigenes]MBB6625257.1 hypothetical protein [Clostridium gasigenes]
MEWVGLMALGLILCYSSYPAKIKKLETKLKNIERNMKGENSMSKILSKLINSKCKLITGEYLAITSSKEIECTILDVDDEWIKFTFTDKKGIPKTKIMRIDSIDRVDLLDN